MGNNLSTAGTSHIRAMLNAALDSETGIRIENLSRKEAIHIRSLLHAARNTDRKKSTKIYEPESPLYDTSPFDSLLTELVEVDQGLDISTVTLRIIRSDIKAKEFTVIDETTGKPINLTEHIV